MTPKGSFRKEDRKVSNSDDNAKVGDNARPIARDIFAYLDNNLLASSGTQFAKFETKVCKFVRLN